MRRPSNDPSHDEQETYWKNIRTWFASAPGGLTVTALVISTGILSSVFSSEIHNSFPFKWHDLVKTPNPWVIAFWIVLAITAIGFFVRQRELDHTQKRLQDQLMEAIRTMPSRKYLDIQISIHDYCERHTWQARTTATEEALKDAIIRVLHSIAWLARKFDEREGKVHYSANIMILFGAKKLSPAQSKCIQEWLYLHEKECAIELLKEVLVLRTDLSATTMSADITPTIASTDSLRDTSLTKVALGIPYDSSYGLKADGTERWRVLPGAPVARITSRPECFPDTRTIRSWCNDSGDLTEDVKDRIEAHFTTGKGIDIRSFVSIPLFDPTFIPTLTQTTSTIGILNIHCNGKDILRTGESVKALELFVAAACPLWTMLSRLLLQLREIEGGASGWWNIEDEKS